MNYGISAVRNINDEVVIDGNYRNFRVVAQGTAAVQSNVFFGRPGVVINLPANSFAPVVFLQVRNIVTIGFYISGGVYYGGLAGFGLPSNIAFAVCDADISRDTIGGYGIEILDASGRTVFHSQRTYMRVVQGFTAPATEGEFTTESVDLWSGYTAMHGVSLIGTRRFFDQTFTLLQAAVRTSNTRISLSAELNSPSPSGDFLELDNKPTFLFATL